MKTHVFPTDFVAASCRANRALVWLPLAAILVATGAIDARAQTYTYVDATSGAGGNTTLSDGSLFSPPLNGTTGADNNWEERTIFASSGNVFEAGGETAENAPEIRTRITGLTPGRQYRIYVHFWDGSGTAPDWNVRAGFSSNPGANTLFANPADAPDLAAVGGVLASSLSYAVAPTVFVEADRTMYAGLVGTATANGAGQIDVFIDDLPSTIGANNRTWYDGLSYWEVIDPLVGPTVITPPIAPVSGTVQLTASVSGTEPFHFRWLSNGVPILNATNQILTLTNVQLTHSGSSYSLAVSNNPNGTPSVVTNAAATLIVRTPLNLVWIGSASFEWNTNHINWDSNADGVADLQYTDADAVRFDDSGFWFVSLATDFYPSRVVVSNEFNPYMLSVPGSIRGNGSLIKQGAASLTLDMDNTYSGGTSIAGGGLLVGTGANGGSVGTGPVTNNSSLTINRTGTLVIPGTISGTGGISIVTSGGNTVGNVILSGANTYSGPTDVGGGTLTLSNSSALGNSPTLTVNSTAAGPFGGTRVVLAGGVSIPSGRALVLNTVLDTQRTMMNGTGTGTFTNTWNGPITINGDGRAQFGSDSGGTLVLNGNINGSLVDRLIARGSGSTLVLNGTVTLGSPSLVQTADGANIRINSTGNIWATNLFANNGRWIIGAHNAIPTSSVFIQQGTDSGSVDLNGFNQQIAGLDASSQIFITNTSASADSTLTFSGGSSTFGGVIGEGTRKLNLSIAAGTLVLTNPAALSLSNSTVTVANGAVLQLDAAATHTVAGLVLNGVSQPPGTYNSGNASPFLAGAGSLLVSSPIAQHSTNITVSVSGGTLSLSWPASHLGWILQAQTNSLNAGLQAASAAWFDVPGSAAVTSTNFTINATNPSVFYRLRKP